ncbi:hypothetical protein LguiB_019330 [Lonicera macranthoides]
MLRSRISHVRLPSTSFYQTLTYYFPQSYLPSIPSNHPSFNLPNPNPLSPSSPSNLIFSSPFSSNRRLFVVQPRVRPETVLKLKLHEALNLANSLQDRPDDDDYYDDEFSEKNLTPHVVVQNPVARSIRPDTYFGKGTVETVKCLLNEVNSKDELVAIFVNATLTGIQQRNLEASRSFFTARIWDIPVLDRVGLIIEIFNAHAQTKEAKLQAELAALMYKRTRLVRVRGPDGRYTFGASGEAEVVSARGRGSGGRGFISGAGETELQLQRRRILFLRNQLLSEIKEVRRTRAVQRAARKRHGGSHGQDMPTVAIVGYTNAGKSTLVSALSQTYLYSDDRLFATVDPKLRSVILPSGRKVLLSDTVGFISQLPVQLVEAFHATLEEVVEADLLVHVLDSSAPNIDEHRETVLQVLQQIGGRGLNPQLPSKVEDFKVLKSEPEDGTLVLFPFILIQFVSGFGISIYEPLKIDLKQEETGDTYSVTEDGIDASELFLSEDIDDDADNTVVSELFPADHVDTMGEEVKDDYSDGWLSAEDGPDVWDDHDSPLSVEKDGPDYQQKELSIGKISHSQTESPVPRVETSAVTGVGLQELLELIDGKLQSQRVVKSNIINRKWRPPREEDSRIVVEQQ